MKILIYYDSIKWISGAARVYCQMASVWAEQGHDVVILSHFGGVGSAYKNISPKIKILSSFNFSCGRVARNLLSLFLFRSLSRVIKEERPDVLIVNDGPHYGQLCGTIMGKINKVPIIMWKHSGASMKGSFFYKLATKLCFPKADAVVALTKGDQEHLLKLNKNTFVINNPSPLEGSPNIDYVGKTALFVGRLAKQKSIDHLLKAWQMAALDGWTLEIVGDGELRGRLERLARELKIDNSVKFMGEQENVSRFYINSSFFVMSSMQEGLPVVLIESLFHGLPMVSYDCPYGPAEVITHGENGMLVENGNIKKLADTIKVMASSEELRRKLSLGCEKKKPEFTLEKIIADWDELFKKVIPNWE